MRVQHAQCTVTFADWRTAIGFVTILACHRPGTGGAPDPQPEPAVIKIAVLASPDSTVKLAKFAMGAIDGVLQLPQMKKDMAIVATRYSHSRRGGGETEIAVIAIVSRDVTDAPTPVTFVRLSAWAVDRRDDLILPQRRGIPAVAQRPPIKMASYAPRSITAKEADDWELLELVLQEFVRHGARRLP